MDNGNRIEEISKKREIPFNKQLRLATRQIHAMSDALVNTKLAFAFSDNSVWAEGLLIFYEIFRFLEGAMERLRGTPVYELYIEGMARTEAFEKDLAFFLGDGWNRNYMPRESVAKYLRHLQQLERNEPIRLMAYIYHLYMGLFSGGQILRKKRALVRKISLLNLFATPTGDGVVETEGNAVTDFGETPIFELKRRMVDAINGAAESLDENAKRALLAESKTVFVLNNSIVKTVRGMNEVLLRKALKLSIAMVALTILLLFLLSNK